MIGTFGVGQGNELAQRRERTEAKKQQHADPTGEKGEADQDDHDPPCLDARVQVFDCGI